jgi:hypothetical protein
MEELYRINQKGAWQAKEVERIDNLLRQKEVTKVWEAVMSICSER